MERKNMFLFIFLFIILLSINLSNSTFLTEKLSLSSTNTWYEFPCEYSSHPPLIQAGTWAWIGSITFKSKKVLKLQKLSLKWSGNFINTQNISASLYQKKDHNQIPMPIEDNLICDGTWSLKNQEIIFHLNEKLIAINKYYLLLSFPGDIKNKIKTGSFILRKNNSIQLAQIH